MEWIFYCLANLLSVWLNGRQPDFHLCFCCICCNVRLHTACGKHTAQETGEKRQMPSWQCYQKWFGPHETPEWVWGPYLYFVNEGTEVGAKTVVGMEAETVSQGDGQ